jgi:hypothetical protein
MINSFKTIFLLVIILFFSSCDNDYFDNKSNKRQKDLNSTYRADIVKEQGIKINVLNEDIIKLMNKIKVLEQNINSRLDKLENRYQSKIEFFTPATFILMRDVVIRDDPSKNGKIIHRWKKKSVFTSFSKINKWYKISGYFESDSWKKSKLDIWIEQKYTKKIN